VEPPPVPKVEPKPEPRPEPKAEPRVEKPDIAIEQEKKRLEEERQRKLAEQKKLDEQKKLEQQKLAEQKKAEEQKKLEEQKKAEEQKRLAEDKRRLEQQNRQRMNDELNRELAAANPSPGIPGARIIGPANVAGATSGDTDAYRARIAAKIKGNVILPMEVVGNPSAEFDVTQLPTGEVVDVKLRKSSGNRTLDEAWERAIRKASPLPKPDQPEAFRRELTLRFRPHD
jgi:colicin import membrane protein